MREAEAAEEEKHFTEEKVNNKNKKHKNKNKNKRQPQQEEENQNEKDNNEKEAAEKNKKKQKTEDKAPPDTNNKRKRKGKKHKQVFPFGNYKSYYGYRIGQGLDEDPRLKVLKREWFHGKDCLDIGCNSGLVTIQIAKKFHCGSICGIDIDSDRISDAYWNLRKTVREESAGKNSTKSSGLEFTRKLNGAGLSETTSSPEVKEIAMDGSPSKKRDLFDIVSFRQENFVESYSQKECYDTVLCLSVTKWIHLNWGDDGLITSFLKMWRLLRPGGILVLEPQPWVSYVKNRRVSERASTNYQTIVFHPECFREILLDKIGFRCVEEITSGLSDSKTGFDRPIFAFFK